MGGLSFEGGAGGVAGLGGRGGRPETGGSRGGPMTEIATRTEAFSLVADGVAAGLPAPWRLYLARGCRYLSISVEPWY